MAASTHEIVVLGGNFGGVNVAHYLLRQSIPTLRKLDSKKSYRVTMVTPNTHFFFKIAAPRTAINRDMIPVDKIFKPIPEAFQRYGDDFRFIRGKATSLDAAARTITVHTHSDEGQGTLEATVAFDSLIITTGTTSNSALWSLHDNHKQTIAALGDLYDAISSAKSVLIAGGGPVAIETAGEIAHGHRDAKITLLASSDRLLPKLLPSTSARALKYLQGLNIGVKLGQPISGHSTGADGKTNTVTLKDGTTHTADLYIDATGASTINTEYLPKSWLDEVGRIFTRDTYFRVRGSGADDTTVAGIYAIGDAVHGTENTSFQLDAMIPVVGSSIEVDVSKTIPGLDSSAGTTNTGLFGFFSRFLGLVRSTNKRPVQREFKPFKNTIVIPIGPNGGVGQLFGWAMPSFMVKQAKAVRFLIEFIEPWITGDRYAKPV